ncbi:MAG: DUF2784 domain-containing protein [Luteolibacter sp.]
MNSNASLLADLVLILHVAFVCFVIFGLLLTVAGGFAGWKWIRNVWFRSLHLAAIGIVVMEAWFGILCPLTTWERSLREQAGQETYGESFIAHWLHKILFFNNVPMWVFTVSYTAFGCLVILTWWKFPPRKESRRSRRLA